ncbi:MAG: glycoside hydrolase family 5 protein [Butyrivibrio sp.]|nr:glycoside hydrolase family 5 protein [Acetatifactor muris]MCM1561182.1 glycoside hydrolase family 5 protein [Butyrivibrio sp.]
MKKPVYWKKKITAAALAALMAVSALGLTACGDNGGAGGAGASGADTQGSAGTENAGADRSDSESGGSEAGSHSAGNADDGTIREELTALELTELMGNGINLGNTMEAYGRSTLGTDADPTQYETFWGQSVTTQEMLDGMKAAGFDTLRLPVAWTNMMNFETGDYTINSAYLDRVEEIVGYARNAGMYVIINDHWDGSWWGMFGSATENTRNQAMELYKSMWTQIAERFKDYSDYVIFESANEELGFRLNDTDIAKDSGTLSDDECYTVANEINQTFVDTVRATGGNNASRFLLIAGFGTDIANTCSSKYKMPADSAENKLLVSVHYYDPSGYCINSSLATWGTKQDYQNMNDTLALMTKFTEQGYGVIIGEYGVLLEASGLKENAADYTQNFLNNCDIYGYCPVLWDCSNLYDRQTCSIIDIGMGRLYTKHSLEIQSGKSKEDIAAQARKEMDADYENAKEAAGVADDMAMAWIMYNSSDWNIMYSVGDTYAPDDKTAGVEAADVEITGAGTYTVSLDFTGTAGGYASSVVFSALAIANGEKLFPGCYVEIQEVLVNGEPYELKGQPYTASDDGACTRVNLYNAWVSKVPDDARVLHDNGQELTPCILDADTLGNVETISVTFELVTGE